MPFRRTTGALTTRKGGSTFKKKTTFKRKFTSGLRGKRAGRGNDGFTALTFKASRFTLQPLPDKFLTWLTLENNFDFPGTGLVNTDSYGFSLSSLVTPFNKATPVAKTFPNGQSNITTQMPTALTNLLYNSLTSTGIYLKYRVWSVKVTIETSIYLGGATPLTDSIVVSMAPIANNVGAYTTVMGIGSGPNSKNMTVVSTTGKQMMSSTYSLPKLNGISPELYAAGSGFYTGTFAVDPSQLTTLQFGWASSNQINAPATTYYNFRVKLQYHTEFYDRADSELRTV